MEIVHIILFSNAKTASTMVSAWSSYVPNYSYLLLFLTFILSHNHLTDTVPSTFDCREINIIIIIQQLLNDSVNILWAKIRNKMNFLRIAYQKNQIKKIIIKKYIIVQDYKSFFNLSFISVTFNLFCCLNSCIALMQNYDGLTG